MKRIFFFIFVILVTAIIADAQTGTFIEAGVAASYGSNDRKVGFPDAYGAIGFKIAEFKDSTVQLRARGKLSKTAELGDLFTRDGGIRHASGELKIAPEVRWNLSTESYFKPFIAAGFEYTRQFGLGAAPYSALNPTLTFGARAGGYEVFYTRLFEDRLNRDGFPAQLPNGALSIYRLSSELKGDRIGASYLIKLRGKLHIKIGAEADRVSYRACANTSCDIYREYDWVVRPYVAFSIF